MYPTLYEAVKDIFGLEIGLFKIVMMFGFFVALAFLAANLVMTWELKRKEKEGIISAFQKPVAEPNPIIEYLSSLVIGFLVGWKIVYLALNFSVVSDNVQTFIMSTQGSVLWGCIVALAAVGYKYYQLHNAKEIEEGATETYHPYMMMANLTLIAAVSGFAGAKLFHHLEHFQELIADPLVLIRDPFSGLTYFGGLIGGAFGVIWYANMHGVKWKTMLDVGAPAMMLSYGIGRMGCHTSGDGDWGLDNLSPKPDWLSWAPDWVWAYDYPNNVHGKVLENPVWPTPMYEVVMALFLFGVLWYLRKRIQIPGILFSIYMIFAGVERYIIEKIRINPPQTFLGIELSQATWISSAFILVGILGLFYFRWYHKNNPDSETPKKVLEPEVETKE